MKEYILNGAAVTDRRELHRALAETMELPDYYGNNLDALMDVLTDIFEETCLIITDCTRLEDALGEYYFRLLKVLTEAHRENPDFNYELRSVTE